MALRLERHAPAESAERPCGEASRFAACHFRRVLRRPLFHSVPAGYDGPSLRSRDNLQLGILDAQAEPMSARTCLTIVLAAGEGTRMRASRPKVLHAIGGFPLIAHVLAAVRETDGRAAVVVGPGQDKVAAAATAALPEAKIFVQAERRGTAHAVRAAREALAAGADDIRVFFADTPLVRPQTLARLREP